jgi:ferredoxin
MFRPAETYRTHEAWRPPGVRPLVALLGSIDRLFDRVYGSTYNPLHRTGTLASLCLTIALVTGVYLLFVYELARPYESMVEIQRDAWLGRWIRALHRYASDVAVVAVALHVLRLLVQGKTWGPRALAWVTGLLLTGCMLLSGMTGFVLVWDGFGQKLAIAGAKMLRLLPLFPEPPDRAFVGDRAVPAQFFFMNLFLHVAVPLGMIAFLWFHTCRLARAAWFPERRVTVGVVLALTLLAVAWPAVLPPAADLLTVVGRVETDWLYAFWLPLAQASPLGALAGGAGFTALAVLIPWILRPRAAAVAPPAVVDPEKCEGCQQCFQDCPFDAIQMVPGLHPEKHPLRAAPQADLCVSCGICAASCSSLAIGPESRTALHQLAAARQLVTDTAGAERTRLVIACRSSGGAAAVNGRLAAAGPVAQLELDCAGTLHPGTVSYLAGHFAETLVLACASQNCVYREGARLVDARILHEQRPAIPGRLPSLPVRVLHGSPGEWNSSVGALETGRAAAPGARAPRGRAVARAAAAAGFTVLLLAAFALASRWPQGTDPQHAVLRLGWRLTGQVQERCRELSAEEQARRPVHMRRTRECVSAVLTYDLSAAVDGTVLRQRRVTSPGLRADRPLIVEEDVEVTPGQHRVAVTFRPADAGSGGRVFKLERTLSFARGRVVLITHADDALVVR